MYSQILFLPDFATRFLSDVHKFKPHTSDCMLIKFVCIEKKSTIKTDIRQITRIHFIMNMLFPSGFLSRSRVYRYISPTCDKKQPPERIHFKYSFRWYKIYLNQLYTSDSYTNSRSTSKAPSPLRCPILTILV